MGEDGGRFFLTQMLDTLDYLQAKSVVHRDLKLENILIDENLNLKVADFGFATFKKINKLQSYRGTMTYMAPEIKEGKTDEYFYNLLHTKKLDQYWKKVGGQGLSEEFKNLILSIFEHDGSKRPTLEEIRKHPWMQKPFSVKLTRQNLLDRLQELRSQKTSASSRDDKGNSR